VEESSAPLEFCCEVPLISQLKKRNGLHNSQSEKNRRQIQQASPTSAADR